MNRSILASSLAILSALTVCRITVAADEPTPPADPPRSAITPPKQPDKGPGGTEYAHKDVVISEHLEGGKKYHLFQPANPKPAKAPVIVFTHGWGAIHPVAYGKWIEHLVLRGNIIIYPHYQATLATLSPEYLPNSVASVKDALALLEKDDRVKPDLDKFALVGHSAGGLIAANLAATAKENGLPEPKALMVVQPGISRLFPMTDMKKIPSTTLLLCVIGDREQVTGAADAKLIYKQTPQIDKDNKSFVTLVTDEHGKPRLFATHMAPAAVGGKGIDTKGSAKYQLRALLERGLDGDTTKGGATRVGDDKALMTDALDYGTWKLFDGLTDAAFFSKNRKYALGNTPEQRFMGKWSDGQAVKELIVTDEP